MKPAQPRGTSWKYDLFLGAWVLYAGYYACRRDIGTSANGSFSHVALELACFGLTYAIGQFIGGAFADDASATKTALSGAFISVVCSLLQGWASPELGLALQLGNGLGQGLGWPALLKLIGQRFDSGERDRVLGWWSTSYILGGFLATVLVQWLAARANDLGIDPFHTIHIVPPAVLLIAAIFFAYKTRRLPRAPAPQNASGMPKLPGLESWKIILRNRSMRYAAGMYFFLKMTRYTLLFWLPHYLISSLGYSTYTASRTASYFEICGIIGPIAVGYITAFSFGRNRMRLGAMMVYALAFMCLVHPLLAASGFWGMVLSISLLGILIHGADMLVSGMAILDTMPGEQHGRAIGFVNGIGSVGQAISPLLATLFVAHFGWSKLFDLFVFLTLISGAICTIGSRFVTLNPDKLNRSGLELSENPL